MTPRIYRQPGVLFEPASHAYTYNGALTPGTTGVLKTMGLSASFRHVAADVLESKRALGQDVHRITHLHDCDSDGRAFAELTHDVAGYHAAWVLFRKELGFTPLLMETPLVHPTIGYAGTLDRFGIADELSDAPIVVDIKTGDPSDAAAHVQTAAYYELVYANREDIWQWFDESEPLPWSRDRFEDLLLSQDGRRRLSVQLRPDGTYKLGDYPGYLQFDHFGDFTAALRTLRNRHASQVER